MKTTLKKIREHDPCEDSWKKLLQSLGKTKADDTEVTIRYILDLLGVEDAIWLLRSVEGHDREIRLFACDCAESVLYLFEEKYPYDNRPRNAIEVARKHANGNAINNELIKSARDARDAYRNAYRDVFNSISTKKAAMSAALSAWYTTFDTFSSVWNAAENAAQAATTKDLERKKQQEYLMQYI